MEWTREGLEKLLLAMGAHALQQAVVHHVALLGAGQCTTEECIDRLLTDQLQAMRFIVGDRKAARMRQDIEEYLDVGRSVD